MSADQLHKQETRKVIESRSTVGSNFGLSDPLLEGDRWALSWSERDRKQVFLGLALLRERFAQVSAWSGVWKPVVTNLSHRIYDTEVQGILPQSQGLVLSVQGQHLRCKNLLWVNILQLFYANVLLWEELWGWCWCQLPQMKPHIDSLSMRSYHQGPERSSQTWMKIVFATQRFQMQKNRRRVPTTLFIHYQISVEFFSLSKVDDTDRRQNIKC